MKKPFFISFLILIVSFIPFLILGDDSFVTIPDNLDSDFIYLHLLKISGNLSPFNNLSTIPNMFNGLGKNYFHSEFSFTKLLFYILPSFWAYVVNSFIVKLIGLVGIQLLMRDYFKRAGNNLLLNILISVTFILLPVYSIYGLSVLGQPILFWSFLNLKDKKNFLISFVIIILFPFYTHFALTAPFFLIVLFLFGAYHMYLDKKVNFIYLNGVLALFIVYIVANYFTIENFLFNEIVSHRTTNVKNPKSLHAISKKFSYIFRRGHYHASSYYAIPIYILGVYAIFRKSIYSKRIFSLLILIVLITLFVSSYNNFFAMTHEIIPFIKSFNVNRFIFMLPLFMFFIILLIYKEARVNSYLFSAVLVFFLYKNILINKEISNNWSKVFNQSSIDDKSVSYSSFYSVSLFNDIKNFIGISQKNYRVVSIGMHPSVSQYNGFYTLDSYQNNYPLSYKNKFREIIGPELEKNNIIKEYFDNWGNRCYIYSAELKDKCFVNCTKYKKDTIVDLDINTQVLKEMGGLYIFSAVEIENYQSLNLNFEKAFENSNSLFKIYLYKIKNSI